MNETVKDMNIGVPTDAFFEGNLPTFMEATVKPVTNEPCVLPKSIWLTIPEAIIVSKDYKPFDFSYSKPARVGGTQIVDIWVPFFLMSGIGMIRRKAHEFKGSVSFAPAEMTEGEMPEVTITIEVEKTNGCG